jgi:formate dehydrogenase major subunit
MSKTVTVTIDGRTIQAPQGSTILDAARREGIHVPTLCYTHLLPPLENCRLCVVAVEGEKQYKAACSTPVADGMVIRTTGPELDQTRKLLLELLLDTHYGDCVAPCSVTCPANVDIQGYLALIRHGEYLEAVKLIKEKIPMPATIGRVCPHPCESACRRHLVDEPVNINHCKRFVADFEMKTGRRVLPEVPEDTGHHVAVVGGGPAGLSAAYYLRALGHGVTIFEARDKLGGMLRYGIPEYRLPKKILDWEIEGILSLGVRVRTGVTWGRDFTLDDLKKEGFGAIFLAIGAWASRKLGIVGEDLEGVESGVDFLENIAAGKPVRVGRRVAVIGGGNVAIDAARSALRLGAEKVTILYRRSRKEMPASHEEIEAAEAEGVEIHLLAAPTRILGEGGRAAQLEFIRMELGEPDASGRRRPVPIEGSETLMDVDQVISAIGQYPMVLTKEQDPGMERIPITRWSTIGGDPRSMHTGQEMIFVGGDLFRGPMTVVAALADGRKAAYSLNRFFQVGEVQPEPLHFNISKGDLESIDREPFEVYKVIPRERMPELEVAKRVTNFTEVELGFDEAQAHREAERCLVCGCSAAFDCRLRELMNEFQVDWRDQPSKKIHFQRVAAIDTHPAIALDPNKCIRCERCVVACRVFQCSDAIDFKDWPRFNEKCVSCGLCVDLCPTGALMEKRQGRAVERIHWRSVPTHCIQCGCGCEVDLKVKGGRLVWIADGRDVPPNHASTCSRGRFRAYDDQWKEKRVLKPLVRENGELREASWGKAVDRAVQGLRAVSEKYGPESVGALASFHGTCEGLYLLQKWMRLGLKTPYVDFPERGAAEALVRSLALSGAGFGLVPPLSSLAKARRIFCIGAPHGTSPLLGTLMRRAARNHGARIVWVGGENGSFPEGRTQRLDVEPAQWPALLCALAARLIQRQGLTSAPDPIQKLAEEVTRMTDAWSVPSSLEGPMQALGEELAAGPGGAFVVDGATLNGLSPKGRAAAFQALAVLAAAAKGNGQVEGAGIYPAFWGSNSLGALLVGMAPGMLPGWRPLDDAEAVKKVTEVWEAEALPSKPSADTLEALESGRLKGLFVQESRHLGALGKAGSEGLRNVEFLVVQENVAGPALDRADVVLPLAAFGEQEGTLVNQEGRFLGLSRALGAAGECLPDWEALSRIMAADGTPFPQSIEAVHAEWKELLPGCGEHEWASLVREKARLADVC